jgi:hypothetical protein
MRPFYLNGGMGWLEVKCSKCNAHASLRRNYLLLVIASAAKQSRNGVSFNSEAVVVSKRAAMTAMGPLATNAVQQIASYSITSSARAGVLPDRMSTPRRPDAGVPQRPRPAPDAHASLLKLPPPQIIFCAATPAPGLRPLVWVNAP